jgi:hypothetical protein
MVTLVLACIGALQASSALFLCMRQAFTTGHLHAKYAVQILWYRRTLLPLQRSYACKRLPSL